MSQQAATVPKGAQFDSPEQHPGEGKDMAMEGPERATQRLTEET
jgi:hypothetical protein